MTPEELVADLRLTSEGWTTDESMHVVDVLLIRAANEIDRLRAELATEEAHHLRTTHMWAEVSDQMAHMVEKCGQQIARAQAAEAAIARVRAVCGAKITWDRRPSKAHRDDVAYAFRLVLAALEGNQP